MGKGPQLTQDQLQKLKQHTQFDDKELTALQKRFGAYEVKDSASPGAPCTSVINIPEFASNPLLPRALEIYQDSSTGNVTVENFIYFCAVLSSRSPTDIKKNLAFRCFDLRGSGVLQYPDVFQLYKLLFDKALADDQILSLTQQALHTLNLDTEGQASVHDFIKLVPDGEIRARLTVDLQLS